LWLASTGIDADLLLTEIKLVFALNMPDPETSPMDEVHQAHLPGNYELYDPTSGEPGPALCKLCWEEEGKKNEASLDTFWISTGETNEMWWLCAGHQEHLKSMSAKVMTITRSISGAVRYPSLGGSAD
jgi:hypothetical protein